jgi:tryptophan synthase alpha chain
MNRLDATFQNLKRANRKGFVGYLTAGDPDVARSMDDIRTALRGGVDVLELGIPFSDPTADGPVIQAASRRALAAGMTVRRALDMVRDLRREFDQPIVLFGYVNPFFRHGYARLAADAAAAGADAFLVVDLPFEEAGEMCAALADNGLHFIPLIAPTTPVARARVVLAQAGGFVYYIMVAGVTGARASLAVDLERHVRDLRSCTALPIAVGFGVSSGAQAREAAQAADAVVVGSALVKAARDGRLAALVKEIREALNAEC